MTRIVVLATLLCLVGGCALWPFGGHDKEEVEDQKSSERMKPRSMSREIDLAPLARPQSSDALPWEDRLLSLDEAELPPLIEEIDQLPDPAKREELIGLVYECLQLRPEEIRLPFLLELARLNNLPSGLQPTILAEMQTLLHEDYGTSWLDWSLALQEHLAHTEGLLRISQ